MDHWFSTGGNLSHRGHLAMLAGTVGCHSEGEGCYWHLVCLEARGAAQHLTIHRTGFHTGLAGPDGSSAEAETPCIRQSVYFNEF